MKLALVPKNDFFTPIFVLFLALIGIGWSITSASTRYKRISTAGTAIKSWNLDIENPTIQYIKNHIEPLVPSEQAVCFPEASEQLYISQQNPSDLAANAILRSDIPRLALAIPHYVTGFGLLFSFLMIAQLMTALGIVIQNQTAVADGQSMQQIGTAVSNVASKFVISGLAVFCSTLSLLILKGQYRFTAIMQSSIARETIMRVKSTDEYNRRKKNIHDLAMLAITQDLLKQTSQLRSIDVSISAIGEHVLENVAMKISATFDQELRKLLTEQKVHLETLVETMKTQLAAVTKEMIRELSQKNAQAGQEVINLTGLGDVAQHMTASIADLKTLIEDSHSNNRKGIEIANVELQKGLAGAFDEVKSFVTEIQSRHDNLTTENAKIQSEILTSLKETVQTLTDNTVVAVGTAQKTFSSASGNISDNIAQLNNAIENILKAAQAMSTANEGATKTSGEWQNTARTFFQTSSQLEKAGSEIAASASALSDATNKTKTISQNQSEILQRQITSIQSVESYLPQFEKATTAIASQFSTVGTTFSKNIQEVLTTFKHVSDALASGPANATDNLTDLLESLETTLRDVVKKNKS